MRRLSWNSNSKACASQGMSWQLPRTSIIGRNLRRCEWRKMVKWRTELCRRNRRNVTKSERRVAPADEYQNIKWLLKIGSTTLSTNTASAIDSGTATDIILLFLNSLSFAKCISAHEIVVRCN